MPDQIQPKFVERVWGKHDLAPLYPAQQKRIGEVWFQNGELLIKFLFTSEKLSVQVHPGDSYAAEHHSGSAGKTEMWHVLANEPGAEIALGFRQAYAKHEAREAAETGAIMGLMQWIPAKAGETYLIPSGTVHALGEGYVICEIQQTSDVTYRMFDYNRKPPRELHLDHSIAVAQIEPWRAPKTTPPHIADCSYFVTDKLTWAEPFTFAPTGKRDEALIVLSGQGMFGNAPYQPGEVWRTTAASFTITPRSSTSVLHTWVP
jgi:mannose-6-phosphate isomerase